MKRLIIFIVSISTLAGHNQIHGNNWWWPFGNNYSHVAKKVEKDLLDDHINYRQGTIKSESSLVRYYDPNISDEEKNKLKSAAQKERIYLIYKHCVNNNPTEEVDDKCVKEINKGIRMMAKNLKFLVLGSKEHTEYQDLHIEKITEKYGDLPPIDDKSEGAE